MPLLAIIAVSIFIGNIIFGLTFGRKSHTVRAYLQGTALAIVLEAVIQDAYGKEGWVNYIQDHWIQPNPFLYALYLFIIVSSIKTLISAATQKDKLSNQESSNLPHEN
jgi:F0F1-type ATP synthase membrane subunit a